MSLAVAGLLASAPFLAAPPGAGAQAPDLSSELSPEHERIGFLVGEWRTTSEFPDGAVGQGELSYRWVLDGSWMRVEFRGDHPSGSPGRAQGMQRWNPDEEAYEAWVFGGAGPPLHYRGSSEGPGHFRMTWAPDGVPATGIDYHRQDDGTVLQENWVEDGGERRTTLRSRYQPLRPPPPPPTPGVVPAGDSSADAATAEEAEILAVLDRLFLGMRQRDASMLEEIFHADAHMFVAPSGSDAPVAVTVRSTESFIATVGAGGEPLHEPYFNPSVRIDGHLAYVWTFYHIYRGDTFGHCGHDAFTLVRTPEGWKIVFLAYTVRPEGCDDA